MRSAVARLRVVLPNRIPGAAILDAAPLMTTQPLNASVDPGETVSFFAEANGQPTPWDIQWQLSTNGGLNFADIDGADRKTLTITALVTDDGNQYQCLFTNSAGTATSDPATLSVTQP